MAESAEDNNEKPAITVERARSQLLTIGRDEEEKLKSAFDRLAVILDANQDSVSWFQDLLDKDRAFARQVLSLLLRYRDAVKYFNAATTLGILTRMEEKAARIEAQGHLTASIAENFASNPDAVDLAQFHVIEDAAATILGTLRTGTVRLTLDKVESLSLEAAENLAKFCGWAISMNSLLELPDEIAAAFSRFKGMELSFDRITELSEPAASALAIRQVEDYPEPFLVNALLSLNGLRTLEQSVAEALTAWKGRISLNGIAELSEGVAEMVSQMNGRTSLRGLKTLTPAVAASLARSKNPSHMLLDCLTQLPAEVAKELARLPVSLSFRGLSELSETTAEALAMHNGDLWLEGIGQITEEVATSLAMHRGELSLGGLECLPERIAQILSQLPHPLAIGGSFVLSPESSEALAAHKGELRIALNGDLRPASAAMLALHKGHLSLTFGRLSPLSAQALSNHEGCLRLCIYELSPEAAAFLLRYKGKLELSNLEGLSDPAAIEIARWPGRYTDSLCEWDDWIGPGLLIDWDSAPASAVKAFQDLRTMIESTKSAVHQTQFDWPV